MEEHFIGRDEYPLWESRDIAVYRGKSKFIFYRGIAVMKLKEPAAFRYSLKGYLDLTEDRTAKYDWIVRSKIAEAQPERRGTISRKPRATAGTLRGDAGLLRSDRPERLVHRRGCVSWRRLQPDRPRSGPIQLPPDGSTATVLMKGAPVPNRKAHRRLGHRRRPRNQSSCWRIPSRSSVTSMCVAMPSFSAGGFDKPTVQSLRFHRRFTSLAATGWQSG